MFLRGSIVLLISIEYLLAAENSTQSQQLQFPALSTSFGNTSTRKTETTEVQNASNYVTENLMVVPNTSDQLNQESTQIEQKDYNFLRPRGKTKFIIENIVHASSNREVPRNNTNNQDQRKYLADQQSDDLKQQQLQLATLEKEEFIQSELHNLAQDIAETELNYEAGKTNTNPRPSSWKSFFLNIFPQGILNVFHLSVSTEGKKSKELPTSQERSRHFKPNITYQTRRVITEWSTLPIKSVMTPIVTTALPSSETPSLIQIEESEPSITPPVTVYSEENKNGSLMTNKDVFDINGAAEVSEVPFEAVIPMESSNVFHIHPLNCEDNCDEEPEDYVDQLSESGDDNVVAFSIEAPKNIFYPTAKPLPYAELNNIGNSDSFYSGTGTQTSEEIIRENTKDFGQKLNFHPAKQLDDFQKEVEKQFDHNEVRIDSEAASRKFLKHFKGKYIKPQHSNSEMQSSNFKAINHFELISSTLSPEVNFQSEQSPLKPQSELHTYIFSAGFNSDNQQPQNGKQVESNDRQDQTVREKPSNSENVVLPYPNIPFVKPENILHTYIFSAQGNNNSVSNAAISGIINPPWTAPNKNTDTKEIAENISNQINSGSGNGNAKIYLAGPYNDKEYKAFYDNLRNSKNDNENNVQGPNKEEPKSYEVYSTNLKPESLLHTYIFSAHTQNNNNNNSVSNAESVETAKPKAILAAWVTPKPEKYSQGLSSFRPTQTTFLCSNDQLKNGDCPYSTTSPPNSSNQPKDLIEIQKSLEQQVKHTKPYVYYNFPPGPPLLSKNPIRVEQAEDSQQSESFFIPESYQKKQQYLQDHQKQLNYQQEYFQQQQIQQYQQKLQYQQQQQYLQKQREQMQKQQEQIQQYQLKQQQQLQEYQNAQQQQRNQQQQELQKQQIQQQQQLHQFQQVQQQQREQQQLQKQQQQMVQYQQQKQQQAQQQLYEKQQKQLQEQQQQYEQQQKQQQEQQQQQQKQEKQQNIIRYNTVKVEKLVPKPYPVAVKEIVEKIVERPVPVERIVEKKVNVPYPVREVVEKIVDRPYPVEKIIDRPVHVPYPVQVDHFIDRPYAVRVPVAVAVPVPVHQYIDRPYPVEKIVEKPIHVPYPVDKVVEKIIEKHIPVEVERIVEIPAVPKKTTFKKPAATPASDAIAADPGGHKNKSKINLEELLELVPPPVDQEDHASYKTIPDDIEFILLDDYNRPVPLDQHGFPWNNPEKRATKNHNIKRSPEFRRNLRVEYGFRPPLIPSVEIGEKGII